MRQAQGKEGLLVAGQTELMQIFFADGQSL
jgi:hypothetical protein